MIENSNQMVSSRISSFIKNLLGDSSGIMAFAGLTILVIFILMAIFAPLIAPYSPIEPSGTPLLAPNMQHLMGTDNMGYDVFSRFIYGSRMALIIAFIATLIASVVGIPLGLIAGYSGGVLDRTLTMIMDSVYTFPGLILAIAIAAVLGPGIINISLSIAVVYIPTYYRVIRSQVVSVKSELYVEGAYSIGAKTSTIIFKYILPNVLPSIIVVLSMNIADAIMTEAGLSFLGLGITPPTPDWGYDLANGQQFLISNDWWMSFFPGIAIILIVLGFSMFAEGLNEYFNPNIGEKR
ncbi:ABC transporter permease [Hippea maritima]|uniref:ABC-type transporter, integral membrane subunit n=1 Tax=Hippea maritima (strain ATCC 700847 / DSM 10411 / MH2) TaxID=760142 RepID=F2LXA6_HIPMA|nr:ABC transporter permease [Hippea maritima]AEA34220.1 ABC-type transporter, integral membrane subunit [Hippea maritima DSM 10411]